MATQDQKIIRSVLKGDLNSFEKLVVRYQDKLISYAQTITGDYASAQDVVQQSFIKIYQNLKSYNPKYKFSSWIYRIVHNQAINSIPRRPVLSLDFTNWLSELIPSNTNLIEEAQNDEIKNMIQTCLASLLLKYKEPLVLYYLQGTKYKEISHILKIPINTVGIRIKRGKELLKVICLKKGIKP